MDLPWKTPQVQQPSLPNNKEKWEEQTYQVIQAVPIIALNLEVTFSPLISGHMFHHPSNFDLEANSAPPGSMGVGTVDGSEIRRLPVEGTVIFLPLFTRFRKHPRWLAGFLPSTVWPKLFSIYIPIGFMGMLYLPTNLPYIVFHRSCRYCIPKFLEMHIKIKIDGTVAKLYKSCTNLPLSHPSFFRAGLEALHEFLRGFQGVAKRVARLSTSTCRWWRIRDTHLKKRYFLRQTKRWSANHRRNTKYFGSISILRFDEPGSLKILSGCVHGSK